MKQTNAAFSNETKTDSKKQGIEEVISAAVENVDGRCHLPSFPLEGCCEDGDTRKYFPEDTLCCSANTVHKLSPFWKSSDLGRKRSSSKCFVKLCEIS